MYIIKRFANDTEMLGYLNNDISKNILRVGDDFLSVLVSESVVVPVNPKDIKNSVTETKPDGSSVTVNTHQDGTKEEIVIPAPDKEN